MAVTNLMGERHGRVIVGNFTGSVVVVAGERNSVVDVQNAVGLKSLVLISVLLKLDLEHVHRMATKQLMCSQLGLLLCIFDHSLCQRQYR